MSRTYDVIVVGAGAAGCAAAASARATDSSCSIALVNSEDRRPYQRTELSKRLADGFEADELALHDAGWYRANTIDLMDGVSVESIDRDAQTVALSNGSEPLGYGRLVLALGGEPLFPTVVRPHERGSFYVLRTARDAEELRGRAGRAKSVLIAGMGVLAVEVAHQLRGMGKQVTLAGATPQLMPRQLDARAGEIMEEALAKRKVKLLFQEEILSFEPDKKKSWSVQMLKHSAHYDMVVFCIGVAARTEPAERAGLDTGDGIKVDSGLRTSDERIFAAGDCAEHPDGSISYLWKSAERQGTVAGANAAGAGLRYDELPDRLATEVFDQHIVSIRKPRDVWNYAIDEFERGRALYALYSAEDGSLYGAIMLNDADRADVLDQAVREGWERDRVLSALGLS
jgi:NADPH-dependent 2,4-dienoyl-CoA reductase/sulfur reductase-like enzyme